MINGWVHEIISGSGGLHDFEDREMAIPTIDRDEAVAGFVIRCLGNVDCKGSKEVLNAIIEHRQERGEE